MKGKVRVELIDAKTGKIKKVIEGTNYTFNEAIRYIIRNGYGSVSRIGIGTDNSAGSPDDPANLKAMLREEGYTRTRIDDYTVQFEHTFTYFDTAYQIGETGLKISDNFYLCRFTFDYVTVDENNNIKIIYEYTVE